VAVVADAMRGMSAQGANAVLNICKTTEGISDADFAHGWKTTYNADRAALGIGNKNSNSAVSDGQRDRLSGG